ncbi:pentapeptide repeat-containing protein, partial [Paraburkholderia sp. RL17-373-BIF-A]|uniref:pentapeptide repeat-containing protein n=1 Tax=Paraburkholderia sp. RL17-373-BIF-A TaxID=3031629 RepID=UPI0038B6B54A
VERTPLANLRRIYRIIMSTVTAQTFARAFLGKDRSGESFRGGTHEAFRGGGEDGASIPTFSWEVFQRVTASAEESMAKQAGDFDISRSRGTVTATITLLTAFIGLLIERVCKSISRHQKEEAVIHAVVDLHEKILAEEFSVQGPGNRSVSVGLRHGGDLKVSEDTDGNGTVLTITVKTGATSESFAIEGSTIVDLGAVLEQEIVRHRADHYLYRQAAVHIPQARRFLLQGDNADLRGVDLRGVDLRGVNLSGADLSRADLRKVELRAMLDHAQTHLAQPAPGGYAWARANSFGLLQILDAAERHEELRDKAMALRKAYLKALPENLIGFVKKTANDMGESKLSYFPLLAREKEVCILLTKDDFRRGMRAPGEPGEEFCNVFVAVDWSSKPDGSSTTDPAFYPMFNQTHLAQFPVLHAKSISRLSGRLLEKIVRSLIPPEYVEGYMLGGAGGAKQDWTTPQTQTDLKRFILPLVGHERDDHVSYEIFSEARFSEDLLEQLFTEAEAVYGAMNAAERAFFLRSLAASLSYASSSRIFGKSQDSPEGLRVLAVAVLNHAEDLDPGAKGFSKDDLENYRAKLLGRGDSYTCTAQFSGTLIEKLRDQMTNNERFETIYTRTTKWG